MSRDFWPTCGYRLLRRHHDGTLALTDEFLRAALLRPELAPLPASSTHELGLHEMLMGEPRAIVPEAELHSYAGTLQSMTQGRATFTKRFKGYEEVPHEVAQRVIDEASKEQEEAAVH